MKDSKVGICLCLIKTLECVIHALKKISLIETNIFKKCKDRSFNKLRFYSYYVL